MYYVGIDIGSTASKTVIFKGDKIFSYFVIPTGWSSKETAQSIKEKLKEQGIDVIREDVRVIATGYGRISVDYADKVVTEITCHGKGGNYFAKGDCTIIDVGGQDTKVITVENGFVTRFLMNDKCSAGTGKFIEIMANRLGVGLGEIFDLAKKGEPIGISSMCTVFAESEVISHIGQGKERSDIAAGVVESVVSKVTLLADRHGVQGKCILTGGLSTSDYFRKELSKKLGQDVYSDELGKYAGALGAALIASNVKK